MLTDDRKVRSWSWFFRYLLKMKAVLFWILLFLATMSTYGQVMLRNEFIIGKDRKIRNKGLSIVAINLDRHPNLNMLVNGKGGRALIIDVQAIRNPGKQYSYVDLASRIYTPGPVYRPMQEPVPVFLIQEPPRLKMPSYPMAHHQHGDFRGPRLQSFRVQ